MVPNVNMNGRLSAFGGVIWVQISPNLRGNVFGFFSFPRSSSLWDPFASLSLSSLGTNLTFILLFLKMLLIKYYTLYFKGKYNTLKSLKYITQMIKGLNRYMVSINIGRLNFRL